MTLTALKALFRKHVKVVPGGPTSLTRGMGVLAALDALAEEIKNGGYTALALIVAQSLPVADPPAVVPGALYGITGDWNDVDTDSTVYVHGVTPTAYHRLGVVYDAQGVAQLVEVDVLAGTYKKLSGGDELLAKNNTWTGENTHESFITARDFVLQYGPDGLTSLSAVAQGLSNLNYDFYDVFGALQKPFIVTGIGRWPYGYDSLQEAIDYAPYGARIDMHQDALSKVTVFRPIAIHGNGYTVAGMNVQAAAKIELWADVVSTEKEAVYIMNGELYHYGKFKHTYAGQEGQAVTMYPSGKYFGRGAMVLDYASPTSTGIISAGDCDIDYDGTIDVVNKGRIARPQNGRSIWRGVYTTTDQGIVPIRGVHRIYASVDARNSGSDSPALIVGQITDGALYGDVPLHLGGGASLLSKPGVRSITYGNPAIGTHYITAEANVVLTMPPDPAEVVVEIIGENLGGAGIGTGGSGTSYTDSQARAAQLNRVAPAGTTTVTLTAQSPVDYGTFSSGTPTIDATNCIAGKGARFAVGAGAQAPNFTNAPSGKPYKFLGATYASGKAFSYSLYVCADRIEVITLAD